eukprot:m.407520 g.407520  ORF g.407520 m.407520 type:complete len:89 (-) comp16798_c0_seq17:1263-1529(-)
MNLLTVGLNPDGKACCQQWVSPNCTGGRVRRITPRPTSRFGGHYANMNDTISGEQASGSPDHTGSVETCCTVTWAAMEMLKLTGLSVA